MRHVYIYYRIDPRQATAAAQAVDLLLDQLTPFCGIKPRRLARCDEPDLWMEIYEDIFDFAAFETALRQFEQQLIPVGIQADSRHQECFVPSV
ncbi:MAG: DUF4936 family protein [Thiobacillus sp.]